MHGFVLEGFLDEANVLFETMARKGIQSNQHSFNTLINGFCKNERISEALCLIETM
jgi:pentatricopeptide repeat protein